jgi:hypothetical protein
MCALQLTINNRRFAYARIAEENHFVPNVVPNKALHLNDRSFESGSEIEILTESFALRGPSLVPRVVKCET